MRRTPTDGDQGPVIPGHEERGLQLTARQRELYLAIVDGPDPGLVVAGYGGAMGGVKTRAIVELAIDAALAFKGNNVLVARQHYTDLSSTTMREFYAACPPESIRQPVNSPTPLARLGQPGSPEATWSTVNFRHLTEWSGLGSQEYGAVLIDEAGEVSEEAARMLLTRLRHAKQSQRWFVAASNPWPGWFQRWFIQGELDKAALQEAAGQVIYVPARIADNPHLPANYGEQQRALHPAPWVDRFIEGRFDALLGRVYPDFDPQAHTWEQPLPHFSRYIGGLDFGGQTETAHYTAAILAGLVRSDRLSPPISEWQRAGMRTPPPKPEHHYTLIRLAEFEDRGPGVIQRLERWQKACRRKYGPIRWAADRSQSAWIDHQRRQGIDVVPASGTPGSILYGVNLVHERLTSEPPYSFYTPELTQFPLRMSEYVWQSGDDPDPRPRKRNDDLLDADRYMHELLQQLPRPFRTQTFRLFPEQPRRRARRYLEPH
ncbi:MAG: phage terminase large subunit [Chloroflexota bacterium]|nr:phage terminase large subunit [Chloroflexota bacterium]